MLGHGRLCASTFWKQSLCDDWVRRTFRSCWFRCYGRHAQSWPRYGEKVPPKTHGSPVHREGLAKLRDVYPNDRRIRKDENGIPWVVCRALYRRLWASAERVTPKVRNDKADGGENDCEIRREIPLRRFVHSRFPALWNEPIKPIQLNSLTNTNPKFNIGIKVDILSIVVVIISWSQILI